MSFAFTMGSFGDFITIIQLIRAVQTALSDSKGSRKECRKAVGYLHSFAASIESVKELLGLPAEDVDPRYEP